MIRCAADPDRAADPFLSGIGPGVELHHTKTFPRRGVVELPRHRPGARRRTELMARRVSSRWATIWLHPDDADLGWHPVGVEPDGGPRDRERWIAIVGDRMAGFEPQDSIAGAVDDAAQHLAMRSPALRWIPTELLERDGTDVLTGASAVWCAPGGPFRSLDGALEAIRWAREAGCPFLGTCAGFQHGVLEFARNVMGLQGAAHAEYGAAADADLFIEELLCSLVGETMEVDLVDSELVTLYGDPHPKERYYCRFGLSPAWRGPLHQAGLLVAGVDARDGDVRVMRLADHPYFVLTLFVPQTTSSPGHPHPLVVALLRAAA